MGKIFDHLIKKQRDKIEFDILLYFLLTFTTTRILVDTFPAFRLLVKGIHIHHLSYGIIVLAIVGYWALINKKDRNRIRIAKLYGIGLGLTFDEFGMWLLLEDNYSVRLSYDAILIILAIFINIIYFSNIWKKIIRQNLIFLRKILKIKQPDLP